MYDGRVEIYSDGDDDQDFGKTRCFQGWSGDVGSVYA